MSKGDTGSRNQIWCVRSGLAVLAIACAGGCALNADPEKIAVPTLSMRGEYDGIASMDDLLKFFDKLPNPDKQFVVMPGIAHASFHQKNYMICYHVLASFFAQPAPVYRGGH